MSTESEKHMPSNDPDTFTRIIHAFGPSVSYILMVALAVWGGTANYIKRIREDGARFSFAELLGEWVISGFAGIITAYICVEAGASFPVMAACSGIAGHMGGRAIHIIEKLVINRVKGDK